MDGIVVILAGVPIEIYATEPRLFRWWLDEGVAQGLSGFSGTGLKVELLGEYREVFDYATEANLSWDGAKLILSHPDYQGWYDLDQASGFVKVSGDSALIAFVRTLFTVILVQHDGFVLHSSALFKDNQAYIFSGQSGAGKSTIIQLTPEAELFSDEMSYLRKGPDGLFYLHHAPFRSEFYNPPLLPTIQLAGVFFLHQDQQDYLERLTGSLAIMTTLSRVFFPGLTSNPYRVKLFHLVGDFLNQTPVYQLHFRKSPDFWRCIQRELSDSKKS